MTSQEKRGGIVDIFSFTMRLLVFILFCWFHSACHLAIDLEKRNLPDKEVNRCSGNEDCNDGHDCMENVCELPGGICKHYVMPAGTLCREKREEDVCDIASEHCDGTSYDCPDDSFKAESVECRRSEGQCDEAEYCTGSSPECPENAFSPPDKACNDGIDCTYDDRCDGYGNCRGINGLHDVQQLSIGPWALYTCALLSTGEVLCWGINNYGNLGDGTYDNRNLPTPLVGLPVGEETTAISSGGRHACVLLRSGRIMCWGLGTSGQLGNGSFFPPEEGPSTSPTPVEVTVITDGWSLVFSSYIHTCAIQENGKAYCWGRNEHGELGNGTFENSAVPVEVTGLAEVSSIFAGHHHTCAIDPSGTLLCWGKNDRGQLGNTGVVDSSPTPVRVEGIPSRVSAVAPGTSHTCALLENGEVMCWGGNNYGELGIGESGDRDLPVVVSDLPSAALEISSGDKHTCVILDGGEVWCWGSNNDGQIGDGTKGEDRFLPVKVAGLSSGAVSVATGAFDTCVLLENRTIRCWGDNMFGQLGDGTEEDSLEPVEVHCQ